MTLSKRILDTFKYLEDHHVDYLDYNTFNEEEDDNPTYQKQYNDLFDELIMPYFYNKLGIKPDDPSLTFNFFEHDDGHWYLVFYNPEVAIKLDDIKDGQDYLAPIKEAF